MAKRRRLIPSPIAADFDPDSAQNPLAVGLEVKAALMPALGASAHPPIARVAGDAATQAALEEVTEALSRARAEGRLVQVLPLGMIDQGYLVRDRIVLDDEELEQLVTSIRSHGQRTPIEVTDLGNGQYGLISGWRRMQALKRLAEETGRAEFGSVLALLRRPAEASDAYVAMVEENEVRQGLSYYERARIAAQAVDLGVFESEKQSLQRLFAAASRARRSKIGSFVTLYRALDDVLRFPAALPERLGLALSQTLERDGCARDDLRQVLAERHPETAQEELALLGRFVAARKAGERPARAQEVPHAGTPDRRELRPGVFLEVSGDKAKPVLSLSGPRVDAEFRDRLERWLVDQH